jgi:hypothetical protein
MPKVAFGTEAQAQHIKARRAATRHALPPAICCNGGRAAKVLQLPRSRLHQGEQRCALHGVIHAATWLQRSSRDLWLLHGGREHARHCCRGCCELQQGICQLMEAQLVALLVAAAKATTRSAIHRDGQPRQLARQRVVCAQQRIHECDVNERELFQHLMDRGCGRRVRRPRRRERSGRCGRWRREVVQPPPVCTTWADVQQRPPRATKPGNEARQ